MGCCASYEESYIYAWKNALAFYAPTRNWPITRYKDEVMINRVSKFMARTFAMEPGNVKIENMQKILERQPLIIPPFFVHIIMGLHQQVINRRIVLKQREEMWNSGELSPTVSSIGDLSSNAKGEFQPLDRWIESHISQTLIYVGSMSIRFARKHNLPTLRVRALWNFYRFTGGPGVANLSLKKFTIQLQKLYYSIGKLDNVDVIYGVELLL